MNRVVRPLTANETLAWLTVLAFFIVGDMATTALGLHYGAIETSPGGGWLLSRFGLWGGMILGKVIVLSYATVLFFEFESSSTQRYLIPAALGVIGVLITVYNTYIILTITGLQ